MKKMCYLLTMGLLAGSLTVPVFAASDADSASDKNGLSLPIPSSNHLNILMMMATS
ncbi:MAG: hypothetical protein ACLTTJ_04650 [Blautia sp.]